MLASVGPVHERPSTVLAPVESALVELFGGQPERASMSFLGVEPIEVLRFGTDAGLRTYVSLGMSAQPMTGAAEPVLAADGPRAELVLELRDPTDAHREVWRRLALLAAAPAVEGVVYVPGMSVDLGQPLVPGSGATGVLVVESDLAPVPTAAGTVAVLRVLPATAAELAWCRVRGAAELRDRWAAQGTDLVDLARRPAELG